MNKLNLLIKKLCPNGVEYKSLLEMFDDIKGMGGVSNKWAEEGNCRFIDYMNAYKNMSIDVDDLPFATVKNLNQDTLKKGDILFTSASEVPNECAIAAAIEKDITEGVFLDDHLFGLRLKEEYSNKFNTGFLKHYFRCEAYRKQVLKAVRGVTRFYISKPDFMKIRIPVPPREVQDEIVRALDNFTELAAELAAELTARKQQYNCYRNKLIDDVIGRKGKLIELLIQPVTDGPHTTPVLYKEGIPFVSATAVYDGKVHLNDMKGYISKEFDEECSRKYKPKKFDVYMVKSGSTTGKVAMVDFDADFNIWSPLAALRTESETQAWYLYHLLQTQNVQEQVFSRMSQGSQPNLSMRVIEQFDVVIPSLDDQERIVNILNKFDTYCNDLTQGLPAEIELRKQQYEYYRDKLLSFKELK